MRATLEPPTASVGNAPGRARLAARGLAASLLGAGEAKSSDTPRSIEGQADRAIALAYAGRQEAQEAVAKLLGQTSAAYHGLSPWRAAALAAGPRQDAFERRQACEAAFEVALVTNDAALLSYAAGGLDPSFLGSRSPAHLRAGLWAMLFVQEGQLDMCAALMQFAHPPCIELDLAHYMVTWRAAWHASTAVHNDPALRAAKLRQRACLLQLGFSSDRLAG